MKNKIVILLIFLLSISSSSYADSQKSLEIYGSSTMQPILEGIKEDYIESQGLGFEMIIRGGGSSLGVSSVISGESDIGMVSRILTDEERERLNYSTIASDAVVVIVNERNKIQNIDREELIRIYTNKIKSWSELGLESDSEIVLISKMEGRSTLDLFEEYIYSQDCEKKDEAIICCRLYEIGSNLEMITVVGGIPNAIGYVSFGTAVKLKEKGAPIKIISLEGVRPEEKAIRSANYPIIRELNLVYRERTRQIDDLISFLSSDQGEKVILENYFIVN